MEAIEFEVKVEVNLVQSIAEARSVGEFMVLTDSSVQAFADVEQAETCAENLTEPFAVVQVLRTGGPIIIPLRAREIPISEADAAV